MVTIGQFYTTTTILSRISKGREVGSATGFFFSDNENVYIVTNKHVIYGENYGQNTIAPAPEIDALGLILHTNRKNSRENEALTVPLFEGKKKIWL